ncbi:MAG TPA: SGNH/GDSL hydrolase family protein [Chthonomonadaceae bacterium]|nr:SGNH/GDSL hydrolase family protein [Chthonomonadaceae bacterium]
MPSEQGFLLYRNATLVCLGDSITQASDGYVRVMESLIHAAYPERNIRVINAGIGGNRVPDMLARLERDVIAHSPHVVTVNVGINDVWHGFSDIYPEGDGPNGIPLPAYEAQLGHLVDMLRESTDAEVILVEPTVIGEDVDNPENRLNAKLDTYVAAMRRIAASRQALLAPTHDDFVRAVRAGQSVNPAFRLTTDGVHLNPVGNHVMALTILATLGFAGL